jgi:DNA-binding NtrC family response regulator
MGMGGGAHEAGRFETHDRRSTRPKRIVVLIDADADSSDSIAIALENEGYHVLTAGTIADGIQLVHTRRSHALVLHLDTSEADGCGMREFARAPTNDTPVALVLVSRPCDPGALAAQLRLLWEHNAVVNCGNGSKP